MSKLKDRQLAIWSLIISIISILVGMLAYPIAAILALTSLVMAILEVSRKTPGSVFRGRLAIIASLAAILATAYWATVNITAMQHFKENMPDYRSSSVDSREQYITCTQSVYLCSAGLNSTDKIKTPHLADRGVLFVLACGGCCEPRTICESSLFLR